MAIEEEAEVEAGEQPKKAPNKLLILAIIGVLLLALLGVGGYIVFTQVLKGGEEVKTEEPKEAAEDQSKLGTISALDPFIVNLTGEKGKRYLKVTMQVELSNTMMGEEVANKMPQIKDSIITVLSSKTMDDLLTIEGKFKLKEQILTRINSLLKTGVVKNVYFVEFVIQ